MEECQKLGRIELSIEDIMKDKGSKGRKVIKEGRKNKERVQKRQKGNRAL